MSEPWRALEAELDAWAGAGQQAVFWWRDDDAVAASPALDRLLDLSARHAVPLSLAVIPGALEPGLPARLADHRLVDVLQHGWRHLNHAPAEAKKCELGDTRDAGLVLRDLEAGRRRLEDAFEGRFLPVLVPPWNRIGGAVTARLSGAGFLGLSVYGPRPARQVSGLALVNTHVDPVDWKGDRGCIGEDRTLATVVDQLAGRRTGRMDTAEPIGLLTHHLVHGQVLWRLLDRLLTVLGAHPASRFAAARRLFLLGEA